MKMRMPRESVWISNESRHKSRRTRDACKLKSKRISKPSVNYGIKSAGIWMLRLVFPVALSSRLKR